MRFVLRSKYSMFVLILALWIAALVHFNPRLFVLVKYANTFPVKLVIYFFILSIDIFWLYAINYVVISIFAQRSKNFRRPKGAVLKGRPSIAVLYTTKNDFCEDAALSCLRQDYDNFHLFLLDDSTEESAKQRVDAFQNRFPENITIVRRNSLEGFKGGNVDNWFKRFGHQYEYFAISDADGILPKHFLSGCLGYFSLDNHIAFVQAAQSKNPSQSSSVVRALAESIDSFYQNYLPARNQFGFMMCFGHGVIFKSEVCKEIGGFPHLVGEDLAFSLRARKLGYFGCFAQDVVCFEDFPSTYKQFKLRHEKVIKGTLENLFVEFPSFLKSKAVSWIEKFDALISATGLFLPVIFLPFLIIAHGGVPFLFAKRQMFTVVLPFATFHMPVWCAGKVPPEFSFVSNWDFYLMTLVAMFSCIFGHLIRLYRRPRYVIPFLVHSAVLHISLMVVTFLDSISYVITHRAFFWTTGDDTKWHKDFSSEYSIKDKITLMNAGSPIYISAELLFGLFLLALSFFTINLFLLGIAFIFLLGPLMYVYGWEKSLIRKLSYVPPLIILSSLVIMSTPLFASQGLFLGIALIHF